MLLSAVFDGQLMTNVTQKVRKANKLLLEVLVDRYGVEVLMIRTNKLDWIKQLKAIAKIRLVLRHFLQESCFPAKFFFVLRDYICKMLFLV